MGSVVLVHLQLPPVSVRIADYPCKPCSLVHLFDSTYIHRYNISHCKECGETSPNFREE